jgi:hypothetical protein
VSPESKTDELKTDVKGEVFIFDVPDDTVLVRVGDDAVTAKNFRDRLEADLAVYKYRNRKVPADQISAKIDRFRDLKQYRIIAELVSQRLIEGYVRDNGIILSDDEEYQIQKKFLGELKYKGSFDEMASQLGIKTGYLQEQLRFPFYVKKAREHFYGERLIVTEREVDEGRARQDRYYERAVCSNTLAYAVCSNVFRMVTKEGLDFAEAGRKYSQWNPEEADFWERINFSEIENGELKKWAFSAPVGNVGGPFELDDGVSIVKMLARTEGPVGKSEVSIPNADVTLARITFRLLVTEPEPRTREYVRKTLEKWKANNAQKQLFSQLHSNVDLTYPNGTNFNFKVKE